MDTRDPLFGSGLRREPVVCSLCASVWDERLVPEQAPQEEPEINLCPSCLLTTSHGEPFPEGPGSSDARRPQDA